MTDTASSDTPKVITADDVESTPEAFFQPLVDGEDAPTPEIQKNTEEKSID